jgi:hypothetical protein
MGGPGSGRRKGGGKMQGIMGAKFKRTKPLSEYERVLKKNPAIQTSKLGRSPTRKTNIKIPSRRQYPTW